jgi:hypothetical protein
MCAVSSIVAVADPCVKRSDTAFATLLQRRNGLPDVETTRRRPSQLPPPADVAAIFTDKKTAKRRLVV